MKEQQKPDFLPENIAVVNIQELLRSDVVVLKMHKKTTKTHLTRLHEEMSQWFAPAKVLIVPFGAGFEVHRGVGMSL